MGAPGRAEDDTSGTCWASPPPTASPRPPAPPTAPAPPPRGLWMQHCPENSRQIFSTASRTTWSLNCTTRQRKRKVGGRWDGGVEEEAVTTVTSGLADRRSASRRCSYLLHVGGEPGRGRLVFFFGALYLFHDHLDHKTRQVRSKPAHQETLLTL